MQYSDYPHTFAALRRHLPQIAAIAPSHRGALVAINTVRKEAGLSPLDIDELILGTLGRIEDKFNATQNEVRPETGSESSNEQEAQEASEKKEVDTTP